VLTIRSRAVHPLIEDKHFCISLYHENVDLLSNHLSAEFLFPVLETRQESSRKTARLVGVSHSTVQRYLRLPMLLKEKGAGNDC